MKASDKNETAALSRDHTILISKSGLLTITGGKWTTYRKMAEDAVNQAVVLAGLEERPCLTQTLRLHGGEGDFVAEDAFNIYGNDQPAIQQLINENSIFAERLHENLPYTTAEVIWAMRHEMARTVEDILSRRTRALLLDAKASINLAPPIAALLAKELGRDATWQKQQIAAYTALAQAYILT